MRQEHDHDEQHDAVEDLLDARDLPAEVRENLRDGIGEHGEDRGAEHRLKGGGRMRVMRSSVFEKVGVNFSHVWGTMSEQGMATMPGAKESNGQFSATGVSLVAHMANPYVPIVHMNVRCMKTSRLWFGGGADLTPTFP